MANKESKKNPQEGPPAQRSNIIQLPKNCMSDNCQKKPDRLGFCETHFEWFKEGLLKKDGTKPKDFDKKYMQYMRRVA